MGEISVSNPSDPFGAGWTLGYQGNNANPEFGPTQGNPAGRGGFSMMVETKYALDYLTKKKANLRVSNFLSFHVRLSSEDACLYAQVVLNSDQSGIGNPRLDKIWMAFKPGDPRQRPISVSASEWIIYIEGKPEQGDWMYFLISLEDALSKIFKSEGVTFGGLEVIRIRGCIDISPIMLHRRKRFIRGVE